MSEPWFVHFFIYRILKKPKRGGQTQCLPRGARYEGPGEDSKSTSDNMCGVDHVI